ncbi:MAG: hypothetical protein ALECFALPRED_001568 [Alectoria fallacina]|uniref:Mid2 domain-containing protein n=1 Tax=Alectoria fallacina TaxID=1903189 RepID=A0A8H3FDB1_9LECA|nr:MAG: hypothetical protein ALECFALPRED_001568 [Alectoria fallacina]
MKTIACLNFAIILFIHTCSSQIIGLTLGVLTQLLGVPTSIPDIVSDFAPATSTSGDVTSTTITSTSGDITSAAASSTSEDIPRTTLTSTSEVVPSVTLTLTRINLSLQANSQISQTTSTLIPPAPATTSTSIPASTTTASPTPTSVTTSTPTPTSSTTPIIKSSSATASPGLDPSAKIGIGLGVPLGLIVLATIGFLTLRYRRHKQVSRLRHQSNIAAGGLSPAEQKGKKDVTDVENSNEPQGPENNHVHEIQGTAIPAYSRELAGSPGVRWQELSTRRGSA